MKRAALVVLVALVATSCGESGPGGTPGSGIEGTVVSGPHCPVERVDSPCPDTPIRAKVLVRAAGGGDVASAVSGRDGRFSVPVAPGTYEVIATTQPFGVNQSSKPVSVRVRSGSFTTVTVLVDTGIR